MFGSFAPPRGGLSPPAYFYHPYLYGLSFRASVRQDFSYLPAGCHVRVTSPAKLRVDSLKTHSPSLLPVKYTTFYAGLQALFFCYARRIFLHWQVPFGDYCPRRGGLSGGLRGMLGAADVGGARRVACPLCRRLHPAFSLLFYAPLSSAPFPRRGRGETLESFYRGGFAPCIPVRSRRRHG